MRAGRRDQLIELERASVEQDDYGEEVPTWSTIGMEWAGVFYGRGDERRQAAMEQGRQPATFQFLSNEITRALTLSDRIQHEGTYDIVGIAPETPKRGMVEVTAVRAA